MTIDIPAFTIPALIFWPVLFTALSFAIGDHVINRFVFRPLARRDGDILVSSRYLPISVLIAGPIGWVLALRMGSDLIRFYRQGRERRARKLRGETGRPPRLAG